MYLFKAIDDYYKVSKSNLYEIRTSSGMIMGASSVYELLADYFPEQVGFIASRKSAEVDVYVNPVLKSIMTRFGNVAVHVHPEAKSQEQDRQFKQLLELDTMKRMGQLELYLQQTAPLSQICNESQATDLSLMTLSVVIKQARNLPKMDLARGVDIFCVIFLEGAVGLFQTEVRRGTTEEHWRWDPALSEDFRWSFEEGSEHLDPKKNLVVVVYDKDQLSSDDLMGCVTVQLGEVLEGPVDCWRKIERPRNAPKRQFLFFDVPQGELDLSVSLCKSSSDLGPALEAEPASYRSPGVRMNEIIAPACNPNKVFTSVTSLPVRGETSFSVTSSFVYPDLKVQDCFVEDEALFVASRPLQNRDSLKSKLRKSGTPPKQ
jgi:hypothetical protein